MIPTINGCEWTTEDIRRVLQNEKYAGNMLLQKAYRENHITKKCLKNKGELPQFYPKKGFKDTDIRSLGRVLRNLWLVVLHSKENNRDQSEHQILMLKESVSEYVTAIFKE